VHPRLKVQVVAALAAGAAAVAVPAAAATSTTTGGHAREVTAIVVVRPGVALPFAIPGGRVLHTFRHVGSELVRMPSTDYAALAADPNVLGVSPDRVGRVTGQDGSDDASGPDSVFASEFVGGHGNPKDAGKGVNVALLDTGVSDTAALNRASGRITDGVDVSTLDTPQGAQTSGQFVDGYGHGTFLASLIAGGPVPGSDGHPLGVAPAARIVVVKVADADGVTSLAKVLAGMDWVAAHARAIQIVNVALAVDRPTAPAYGADPLTAAVEHVRAAGVLVVAAAGNDPTSVGDPGMDPQALTVGAADLTGKTPAVAAFSGSGVVAGVQKPDVVASGVHVLGLLSPSSEIAQANPDGWQPDGLFRGSGTSEATAVASGVAAAWLSDHKNASPADAKAALRAAANAMSSPRAGVGLVQVPTGNARGRDSRADPTGEASFDSASWQANAWQPANGGDWESWLASSWSGPAWDASSWSASSWSASSWSASSWSDYGWGDAG